MRAKRKYPIVHKGQFTVGISKQVRRERAFHLLRREKSGQKKRKREQQDTPSNETEKKRRRGHEDSHKSDALDNDKTDELPACLPEAHHQISFDVKNKIILPRFLKDNQGDPSLRVR